MPRDRQPLREHRFRLVMILIGLVIGIVVAFVAVPLITGRGQDGPWWEFAVGIAVAVVVGIGGTALGLWIGNRLVGDRIEAAVREPGGKWRHGRFSFGPDGVTFERYRWQLRIPSARKTHLTGVRLGADTGQRPPWRQLWTINPQLHIVTLDADQGRWEVAAMPSRLRSFGQRLGGLQLDAH